MRFIKIGWGLEMLTINIICYISRQEEGTVILDKEDIDLFGRDFSEEKLGAIIKTRQCRKIMGKAVTVATSEDLKPLITVADVMYAGIGRIKGFPEDKSISYEGKLQELWEYVILKIDSCKEKHELFQLLMIFGLVIKEIELIAKETQLKSFLNIIRV
jgi:hypothetical protein